MEKLARNKHSSLLQKSVNYSKKSFLTLAPGSTGLKQLTHKPRIRGSNPGANVIKQYRGKLPW